MTGTDDVSLELEVEDLFEQGVRANDSGGGRTREEGFHISGLSYDCLRNIQYAMDAMARRDANPEQEIEQEEDFEGIFRMWMGTKLHETPLTPKHEWGVYRTFEMNGEKIRIHGHIDEIHEREDGTEVVIDKKFVAFVPKYGPNDHHKRQVSYYAALYAEATGAKVERGVILYVTPVLTPKDRAIGSARKKAYTFPIDIAAARQELEEKVRAVAKARQDGVLAPRTPGWLCTGKAVYCKWLKACELASGPVKGSQQTLNNEVKVNVG